MYSRIGMEQMFYSKARDKESLPATNSLSLITELKE